MVTFYSRFGGFLKWRIDIFAAEKPNLDFYGIKTYTEYISFLNRGRYIFCGLDANRRKMMIYSSSKVLACIFETGETAITPRSRIPNNVSTGHFIGEVWLNIQSTSNVHCPQALRQMEDFLCH